jgi:hypothetical protein
MRVLDAVVAQGDRWQRSHRYPAILYGVLKKFGDDDASHLVVDWVSTDSSRSIPSSWS